MKLIDVIRRLMEASSFYYLNITPRDLATALQEELNRIEDLEEKVKLLEGKK